MATNDQNLSLTTGGHIIRSKCARDLVVDDVVIVGDREINVSKVVEKDERLYVYYHDDEDGLPHSWGFRPTDKVTYYRSLEIVD
jgi:hypothetical protein